MEIDDALLQFCKSIPKIELHAHLNGCVRIATLRELAISKNLDQIPSIADVLSNPKPFVAHEITSPANGAKPNATLQPYFAFFGLIHQLTTSLDVVRRITREAIEDFIQDNVKYLELRTTPKHRPAHGITKESYMLAVLDGINDYNESCRCVCGVLPNRDIDVRLLLSIDRRETPLEALETVTLALHLAETHPFGWRIAGIDLGGDPSLGQWEDWRPAMDAARAGGLKIALHCAELWHEEESLSMVAWRPDRLGHMVCMGEILRGKLLESRIPVEICLSSNVKTGSVKSFKEHHFEGLYKESKLKRKKDKI